MELRVGDQIPVFGALDDVLTAVERHGLSFVRTLQHGPSEWMVAIGMADVMVHPESNEFGNTFHQLSFRSSFDLELMGMLRQGEPLSELDNVSVRTGDRFLVARDWQRLDALVEREHDYVPLGMPGERKDVPSAGIKYAIAIAILSLMVGLTIFNIVPVVVAVLVSAILAVIFRTLSAETAYKSIHWSSIVLAAGMLPLADALGKTGASQIVVDGLLAVTDNVSPQVVMAILFSMTAGLGFVLSNTATAVLVAPIAIAAAESLGVSLYPMVIAVLMAASSAFSTPVSTPVVTLVVAPGGYTFIDFLKIGLPFTVMVGVITILITPLVFPF